MRQRKQCVFRRGGTGNAKRHRRIDAGKKAAAVFRRHEIAVSGRNAGPNPGQHQNDEQQTPDHADPSAMRLRVGLRRIFPTPAGMPVAPAPVSFNLFTRGITKRGAFTASGSGMPDIINLNRHRKKTQRKLREKRAQENRILHGERKADRKKRQALHLLRKNRIDALILDKGE